VLSVGSTILTECAQAIKRWVCSRFSGFAFISGDKLKTIKLTNAIKVFRVAGVLEERSGYAFLFARNVSGASETCCGFSLAVKAELLTGRWVLTRAMLLFGCRKCSSDITGYGGDGISLGPKVR
jgi:hypothetical protein